MNTVALMVILTVIYELGGGVTQTTTETTMATCQQVKKQLEGSSKIRYEDYSAVKMVRRVDCIPVVPAK
jgi:hypothetical protein